MFRKNFKIAFRNTMKYRGHSFINIIGLSVGMAACMLLFLWVQDELSYDRYHKNAERIYRVIYQWEKNGQVNRFAVTPAPLGPALVDEFPEIQKAVRFGTNKFIVRYKKKIFQENIFWTDPEIFDVFTFRLYKGDPQVALKEPYSILISEEISNKYFGEENPIGKIINLSKKGDYRITGVFKNIPSNSHFRFDFLGPFSDYEGKDFDQWGISNYYTYILVSSDFKPGKFREKLHQFIEKYKGKSASFYKTTFMLQPLTRIHLHSDLRGEIQPNGDIGNIYIFTIIAFFILVIACLNYINLSTARNINRAKEVGIRKALGATLPQLLNQFLMESFLLAFIIIPFAVILTELFLPIFNSLSNKHLVIHYFNNFFFLGGLAVIILFVGFVPGILPAFFISILHPVNALKGEFKTGSKVPLLKKSLVISQFSLSIIFIISAVFISNQLNYMRNRNLGIDNKNIVNIPIYSKEALKKYEMLKDEFLKHPSVKAVCASSFFLGKNNNNINYWREGASPDQQRMINCINVDHDFIKTFSINCVKGRNFSKQFPSDLDNSYIVNESAIKEWGWQSPIGKQLSIGNRKRGTVIGVVEDFHFKSLHQEIEPMVLYINPDWFSYFSVKIAPQNISETLNFLKTKWQEIFPEQSFQYSFMDNEIQDLYSFEAKLAKIFIIVTLLSIFISCLGLFGLAAFTIEQRIKEISIRKVLGSSVLGIWLLLSKEFSKWVLMANIIAWPIAWFAINQWLQNFAYRIGFGIWIFLLAGLIALVVSMLTISVKSVRAAMANPVKGLRFE